jgi:hypothetical protein
MTYRRRTDKNQQQMVLSLRMAGFEVYDKSACGLGVSDLIICRGGRCEWLEVKPSHRSSLTDKEREFFDICPGGPPILAWTPDLAIAEFEARALAVRR